MRPGNRRVVVIAGVSVALIMIAAIAALLLLNIDYYKSKIQATLSEATGLDVVINGKTGFSLFPLGMSAKNVRVTSGGDDILSLESLKIGVEVIPLLKQKLEITRCVLVKPTTTIVKTADGKYNFEGRKRKRAEGPSPAFSFKDLELSEGSLSYLDRKTGETTELKGINLSVKDVSVADTSGDLVRSASFTGSFDCKEILRKDLKIENLKGPVKAERGVYAFQPLTIATLSYFSKGTREKAQLKGINLAVKDLSVGDTSGEIVRNLSFTGSFDCKEILRKDLRIENVKGPVKAINGVYSLKPLVTDVFGGKGEGVVTADVSGVDAAYDIDLRVSQMDLEKLESLFGTTKMIGGKGNLSLSLKIKEKGSRLLLRNLNGTFALRGDNLLSYTVDLDKVLSKYEASQKFHLVDLGAYFIVGPLGTLALKGYRYGDVYYQTQGGHGTITQFLSHWKIRNGTAEATDCALSTHHNRVALKGALNLVSERYENVVVALLDDGGCAKMKQNISGSFGHPSVGTVSVVESLAGPFFNLYRQAKRFVQAGKCEVFYRGSVQQPR